MDKVAKFFYEHIPAIALTTAALALLALVFFGK